jgi:hypothetical protein
MLKIARYPQNADGTPMDLEVGVLTDASGNSGARLTPTPVGPDNAPIDAKALILVDSAGTPITIPNTVNTMAELTALPSGSRKPTIVQANIPSTWQFTLLLANPVGAVAADTQKGLFAAPDSDPTGATGVWMRTYTGPVNIKFFGAQGDGVIAGAAVNGTDDLNALQGAENVVNFLGGGTIYYPTGKYKHTASIQTFAKITHIGDGPNSSQFVSAYAGTGALTAVGVRSGSAFYSIFAANNSTRADIHFRGIGFKNVSATNGGAGYYDFGGTFITMVGCYFEGFKWGSIKDQSELFDHHICDFEAQLAGGAGIWYVNGADLVAGANGGFTNRSTVMFCQFNEGATTYGILDDGGACHTFQDNNYNGCLNHIRVAGVDGGLNILNGEFESAAGACVVLASVKLGGAGVGSNSETTIRGTAMAATSTNPCISVLSAGGLTVDSNTFATPSSDSIVGIVNCAVFQWGINYTPFVADKGFDNYATQTLKPMLLMSAQPAAQFWRKGQIVYNNNTAANDIIGWRCVTSGSPGTWETLLPLTPGDKGDVVVSGVGGMVVESATPAGGIFNVTGHLIATGHGEFNLTGGYVQKVVISSVIGEVDITNGGDGDTADINLRPEGTKKGVISFTHAGVADRWSFGLKGSDGNLYWSQDRTLAAVKMSLSGTALNLASGVALNNNAVAIINGSGVLQAAGFPALTGDVTTSAGSLATSISSATVVSKIATQAIAPASVAATGNILTSGGKVGYATGSGGTIAQITSRTTTVTINKSCGAITLVSAAGSATFQSFSVSNSQVQATDTITINQKSGTDKYQIFITNVAAGGFQVTYATTGGTTVETPVFNFTVNNGVNA